MGMRHQRFTRLKRRLATATLFVATIFVVVFASGSDRRSATPPLTTSPIQLERDRVGIHYVVDMAEISTFRSCK